MEPVTSGDYAEQLKGWCIRVLDKAGHSGCGYAQTARYMPEEGVVVCGCGQFTDAPVIEPEPSGDEPDEVLAAHAASTVARRGGTAPYVATDPIQSTLALIDPTDTYTPDELERHILDVLARLETGALFERECIVAANTAVDAWDRAYWRAFHACEATSDGKRKAAAMVACDDAGLTQEKFEAESLKEAVKATMHNLRAVLSGYQSVAKSVTAAYNPGGSAGRF